jgi:hypothetical protein
MRGRRLARILVVALVLALTAVLFVGCGGGGDDRAKVEASLQDYLDDEVPVEVPQFPIGAGVPQVRENGCKDRHVKTKKGQYLSSRNVYARMGEGLALWSCVVRFGTLALPVLVAVVDRTDVAWAIPGEFKQFKLK